MRTIPAAAHLRHGLGHRRRAKAYLHQLEEAEKRDHRRFGREMDLFHFQEEAPGAVFWHPKGWALLPRCSPICAAGRTPGLRRGQHPDMLERKLWESRAIGRSSPNMYIAETPEKRICRSSR